MIPQMFVRVPKVNKASDLNADRFCDALALQNPLSQPCKERSKVMGSKGEEIIVSVYTTGGAKSIGGGRTIHELQKAGTCVTVFDVEGEYT
jgi:hypothetical protein